MERPRGRPRRRWQYEFDSFKLLIGQGRKKWKRGKPLHCSGTLLALNNNKYSVCKVFSPEYSVYIIFYPRS